MKEDRYELWNLLQTMPPDELVRVWSKAMGLIPEATAMIPNLERLASEVNAHRDREIILCGLWDVLGAKALAEFKAPLHGHLGRALRDVKRRMHKPSKDK